MDNSSNQVTFDPQDDNKLKDDLKPRHMTMLAIAGVIGAALFVGSGRVIATAGPAVILAYMGGGLLVTLVMRMLGEMAVARPDTGSFSTYADEAIGRWAGFTIGWLYWYFWVFIMGWEAYVAGAILNAWIPTIPGWVFATVITVILIIINCLNVKNYGEFEFWFALIKVVAIIIFLVIGSLAICYLWPFGTAEGFKYLTEPDGFAPNGWDAVVITLLGVMFSFMGAEIATIASSETKNSSKAALKATKSIVWRISLFYIGSIFIVVCLVPWNDPRLIDPSYGSYYVALDALGFDYAQIIINFIVLTSVCSCFNSALYTASRMLYSLAVRGDMHRIAMVRNKKTGAPYISVLLSTVVTFIAIYLSTNDSMDVYDILMETTGAIALYVYLAIAFSQLKLRRKLERENEKLELKMWFFPWLTYAVIGIIIVSFIIMVFEGTYRAEVLYTTGLAFTIMVTGMICDKFKFGIKKKQK